MPDRIFVYGTLRRGYDHPMARHLAANAKWLGQATCRGRLYLVATYPGLVLSSDAAEIVHGDAYALDDQRLIVELDAYEGCGPNDPVPHPYVRTMIDINIGTTNGPARAWTYIYQRPVAEERRIASGRFTAL